MPASKLNRAVIEAAIVGFQHQKTEIDNQIAELRSMLTGSAETVTPEATPGKRKKFSAAARKRMALAQKARWAKIKGGTRIGSASPRTTESETETFSGSTGKAGCESGESTTSKSSEGEIGGNEEHGTGTSTEAEAKTQCRW